MSDTKRSTRPVVAVVGGGQLARMMQESAIALGIELRALVEARDGSTGQAVVEAPVGEPDDPAAVAALVRGADVLTFEHEHVPQSLLAGLPPTLSVNPPPAALRFAQDKLAMRERLGELGVPCPRWARLEGPGDLTRFGEEVGWPVIVKTPVGGYDGHGVRVAQGPGAVDDWFREGDGPLLAEEKVPFSSEIAALLARRPSGEIRSWPVAQTIQAGGVCSAVIAPAPLLAPDAARQAREIGEAIARELGVTGVLAVEMFVVEDEDGAGQRVLVNELAMRPHNSGHWTIDGSVTSQFEQHLRAVLDLPLGDTATRAASSVMVNLLGSSFEDPSQGLARALAVSPDVRVHLYGKSVRPGRKLGHVTVCGGDLTEARALAEGAVAALRGESPDR
nr:5-(carboxyamino)imidazole ribonucleotide synthase [Actinomyces sp.]